MVKQLHADLFVPMKVSKYNVKLIMFRSFLDLKGGLSAMLE
jgi:hypothetical protein